MEWGDNKPQVRPGTKFNFGTVLMASKRRASMGAQPGMSEETSDRVVAQMKQICRMPLSAEDRQWLDVPIPRMYLQPYEQEVASIEATEAEGSSEDSGPEVSRPEEAQTQAQEH